MTQLIGNTTLCRTIQGNQARTVPNRPRVTRSADLKLHAVDCSLNCTPLSPITIIYCLYCFLLNLLTYAMKYDKNRLWVLWALRFTADQAGIQVLSKCRAAHNLIILIQAAS